MQQDRTADKNNTLKVSVSSNKTFQSVQKETHIIKAQILTQNIRQF